MTSRATPPARVTAIIVLGLLCGGVAPGSAWSAGWFGKLPADDPDMVRPRHSVTPAAPEQPRPASAAANAPAATSADASATADGGVPRGVYSAATGVLWSVAGAAQYVA